ncbi:MAG: alpha/beta hydrolase [SAR202 cluster bacterium]|nr:alpha/beta hydrolase [SAR202 cluster bacterium]
MPGRPGGLARPMDTRDSSHRNQLHPVSRHQSASALWVLLGSVVILMLAAACAEYAPQSSLFDVGGRRLHISCAGVGAPPVLLDSGLASDNHDWPGVQRRVSEFTQVCSYDRAGLGRSDPASTPRTSQDAVDDMHALLANAGVTGPVVLVGHSYGGLNAQLYSARHPENVAGVVLLDSLHPDTLRRARELLGEQEMGLLMSALRANLEGVDLVESMDQVQAAGSLGILPLTVIAAGNSQQSAFIDQGLAERLTASWADLQVELADLSLIGTHLTAEKSGHCIQCDQPKLVADAIKDLVKGVRRDEP